MKIYWVEDFLSGAVLENRHYASHEEAVIRRNELGYGVVKWTELPETGACPMSGKCSGCG